MPQVPRLDALALMMLWNYLTFAAGLSLLVSQTPTHALSIARQLVNENRLTLKGNDPYNDGKKYEVEVPLDSYHKLSQSYQAMVDCK